MAAHGVPLCVLLSLEDCRLLWGLRLQDEGS